MVLYNVDYKYSNDIELMEMVLTLYAKTVYGKNISGKETTVLRNYMLKGYSKRTKKSICSDLKIKPSNLDTLNYTLKNKGFLHPHPTNQQEKLLDSGLEKLKEAFSQPGRKLFTIDFKKVER